MAGFNVSIKLEGVTQTMLNLDGAKYIGGRAAMKQMYIEAEKIMGVSKALFVPVDHGNLRSSGHVALPKMTGPFQWVVEMGYGGPAVPYAVVQHERLDYKHTVGEAKYLEKPTLQAAPHVGKRVGMAVAKELRKLQIKQTGR
jgi:hypothetical protein